MLGSEVTPAGGSSSGTVRIDVDVEVGTVSERRESRRKHGGDDVFHCGERAVHQQFDEAQVSRLSFFSRDDYPTAWNGNVTVPYVFAIGNQGVFVAWDVDYEGKMGL